MLCFVRKRDPWRFCVFASASRQATACSRGAACRLLPFVTRTIKAQRPALDSPQGPESNRSLLVVLRCQTQQEQPAFTNEFGQGATRWWDFETFWRTPVTVQATSLLSTSFLWD